MSPISMSAADDGVSLANYRWNFPVAAGTEKRGIYIIHGLSEYAGRYSHVATWLNARGWQVAAHDHRGHGRSGGRRAGINRPEDLERDAAQRIAAFHAELDSPPLVLGHSLGGVVAAQLALDKRCELSGLILCSPAFTLHFSTAMTYLVRTLAALTPNLAVPHRFRKPRLTHDQTAAKAYLQDPLVNHVVTPRLIHYIEQAGNRVRANAQKLDLKTLLLVAGSDLVVSPSGSRLFAHHAPPGKVALRWYDQAWHELLQEAPEIARPVYADLNAWLSGV